MNEDRTSYFQRTLRQEGKSEATIAAYSRMLKAALNWAVRKKLLHACPDITIPKKGRAQKVMKGRPITTEEFERMLAKVPDVVGDGHAAQWRYYLEGLWWSGLRLGESLNLYWDERPDKLQADLFGRRPMLRIPWELDKGNEVRLLPIAPEFAEHLLRTPEDARRGRVFKVTVPGKDGEPRLDWVSPTIARIGEKAKVKVREGRRAGMVEGERRSVEHTKYASAHDLRRAFGSRWSTRVMPQVLKELMRHADISTTMKYYVGQNAERTADAAWAAFEASDISGDSRSLLPSDDVAADDAKLLQQPALMK